jgi:hypothetical protein
MSSYRDKINRQKEGGLYRVSDLQNGNGETREVTHEIAFLVQDVEMFDREIDILHFVDTPKQLQVNVTNADLLMDLFGDDPASWPGNLVTLYLAEYEYGKDKKRGLGIRVKKPGAGTPSNTFKPPTLSSSTPDFDDQIPF